MARGKVGVEYFMGKKLNISTLSAIDFYIFYKSKISFPLFYYTQKKLPPLHKFRFTDLITVGDSSEFDYSNCFIYTTSMTPQNFNHLKFDFISPDTPKSFDLFFFEHPIAPMTFRIGGCNISLFYFSEKFFSSEIILWDQSTVVIGEGVTCNHCRIESINSILTIGLDSMLSDYIFFQCSDQHGIVEMENISILPVSKNYIHIGRHVWIGRKSLILKNTTIGSGSIIGAGALVTKSCPRLSIMAGNPAKIIKENRSWSRSRSEITENERRLLIEISKSDFDTHQL